MNHLMFKQQASVDLATNITQKPVKKNIHFANGAYRV